MRAEARWVVDAWAEEVKTVLQFLTAEEWTCVVSDSDSGSAPTGYFWWSQKFDLTSDAQVSVGAPALAWSELGARVLQAAGVDLIEQASAKSTYLETLQQSMSGLCRHLSERCGRVVEASGGRAEGPSRTGLAFEVITNTGGFDLPALRVVVSEALCAASTVTLPKDVVKAREKAAIAPSAPVATVSVAAPAIPAGPTPTPAVAPGMSVLLDVQMPVSICFGHASMPLREVLKLTSGSAVELDRRPDDEVDIIVNDCVIARGEVVVIDGNYGVRVTGIVSREQRLALRTGAR